MDHRAAGRLRILGILVVVLFFMFAVPIHSAFAVKGAAYQNALAATLAFGIALLLLAEIAPLVKTFRAGGVEVEFMQGVTSQFNDLEKRITHLQLAASHPDKTIQEVEAAEHKAAPALNRKKHSHNDQWKGRFGGQSTSKGFRLSAEFKHAGRTSVQILLKVTAGEGARKDLECVEFYLHETFDPDVVPALFHAGQAELSVLAYGGFTVGAWIPCVDVELELDLSELPKAPRIIKEN